MPFRSLVISSWKYRNRFARLVTQSLHSDRSVTSPALDNHA